MRRVAMMLKSNKGHVKSEVEWRAWIDEFWEYAEKQNKDRPNRFIKPKDYFQRIVKLLGLKPVGSWKGVF
jgi:hypothetical protein